MTQETLTQETCQTLICFVQDFPASHFQLLEKGEALQMPEGRSSLKLPDCLKTSGLSIFSLKTYPDCYHMTRGGRFTPSLVHFLNWGIVWNGKCLTAKISESRRQERECILSDILMDDVPEKYFLTQEQTRQLLYNSFRAGRGAESTTQQE